MIIKGQNVGIANPDSVSANIRCPGCGQLGTFEKLVGNSQDFFVQSSSGAFQLGERRCPNLDCRAIVFFVWKNSQVVKSYPPLRIDFDKTKIPVPVVSALEEAITSHANECYIAAAIMVRKTLEELCRDRGAQGSDLRQRISDLGNKIVLPKDLLDGLDDLRILGNDAAHIESREYDRIGKEEVEAGIEFTKVVLKAAYQYSALVDRLRQLKKSIPDSQPSGSS